MQKFGLQGEKYGWKKTNETVLEMFRKFLFKITTTNLRSKTGHVYKQRKWI